MRVRGVALLLLISVASAACASRRTCCPPGAGTPGGRAPVLAVDREAETKAVYVAVLRDLYLRDWLNREIEQFVIDPDVSAFEGGSDLVARERMPEARADTLADFEKPRPGTKLPSDLAPGRPVRWFSRAEFAALPKSSGLNDLGWTAFHERFPGSGGHITLSRVGFSSDRTEALVHAGRWFDSLGGAAQVVRLEKVGGTWQVKKRSTTVVS